MYVNKYTFTPVSALIRFTRQKSRKLIIWLKWLTTEQTFIGDYQSKGMLNRLIIIKSF